MVAVLAHNSNTSPASALTLKRKIVAPDLYNKAYSLAGLDWQPLCIHSGLRELYTEEPHLTESKVKRWRHARSSGQVAGASTGADEAEGNTSG